VKLLIYSRSEFGFWSNRKGWVQHAADASVFTRTEAKRYTLPMSKDRDAVWIKHNKQFFMDDFAEEVVLELTDEEALKVAQDTYQIDGEIEIDSDAKTSRGSDRGCYVQAWVWVYWPEAEIEEIKP
jgi:hypothetical protein